MTKQAWLYIFNFALVLSLPQVSNAQEFIEIKKTSVAGICSSLAAKQIYECAVTPEDSIEFIPVSVGCPIKFKMKLGKKSEKYSAVYRIEKRSSFPMNNHNIENTMQKLFSKKEANERTELYQNLETTCAMPPAIKLKRLNSGAQ